VTEALPAKSLVIARHGQTAWNALGRGQGHIDVELDETGHGQAASIVPALAAMNPTRLWTSDLTRARQSMAYLEKRTGLVATPDERLREYDLGVRSGLTFAEFAERYPDEYAAWERDDESRLVRGAETTEQVRRRVGHALRECWDCLGPGETGIVMMHGTAGLVGIAALLDWSEDLRGHLRVMDNAAWAVVAEHPVKRGLRLVSYNVTGGRLFHPTAVDGPDFASGPDVG